MCTDGAGQQGQAKDSVHQLKADWDRVCEHFFKVEHPSRLADKPASMLYVDADPADVRCPRRTQTPNRVYVWIGAVCPAAYATAARYHAKLLLKYEQPHLLQQYQGSQEPAILEVSSQGGKAWVVVIGTLM